MMIHEAELDAAALKMTTTEASYACSQGKHDKPYLQALLVPAAALNKQPSCSLICIHNVWHQAGHALVLGTLPATDIAP